MKLQSHELKRLRTNALVTKTVSPDTKQLILKNELSEFAKDVFDLLQRKKSIKSAMVVLVESDQEAA
jgi:hypothetical protein